MDLALECRCRKAVVFYMLWSTNDASLCKTGLFNNGPEAVVLMLLLVGGFQFVEKREVEKGRK